MYIVQFCFLCYGPQMYQHISIKYVPQNYQPRQEHGLIDSVAGLYLLYTWLVPTGSQKISMQQRMI